MRSCLFAIRCVQMCICMRLVRNLFLCFDAGCVCLCSGHYPSSARARDSIDGGGRTPKKSGVLGCPARVLVLFSFNNSINRLSL